MVGIGSYHFHHVTVLVRGGIHIAGTVDLGIPRCFSFCQTFGTGKVNLRSPAADQSVMAALKALKSTNSSPASMSMAEARVVVTADKGGDCGGSDEGDGDGDGDGCASFMGDSSRRRQRRREL